MSEKVVQLNEEIIKGQIKELVRGSVEKTFKGLQEAEAEMLTRAARQGYRGGHYSRNPTTSGDVRLDVPRFKGVTFETAIIERYHRRESSTEEAFIEMHLAGVSMRRVEDINEALWGSKVSPPTISELSKKAYVHIED